ncbi:MAG: hypothetical protein KAR12_00400 [Methylococcales bacterium]|nr:hypothetical protein [Methylococcales bacterium]
MRSTKLASTNVWQTAMAECDAMVDHAFASGTEIPPELMVLLYDISCHEADTVNENGSSAESKNNDQPTIKAQQLTLLHNKLAAIVAPASPRTLLLMREEAQRGGIFLVFGRVPFIRYMMAVAIIALISLITISMSKEINNATIVLSIFENSGTSLLRVQLLFISAAALGASFSALFQANQYIVQGTFDPKYEASYWVKFVVGLIAGIILTQVIPTTGLEYAIESSPVASTQSQSIANNDTVKTSGLTETNQEDIRGMIKITLALLGGFSASLVYLILNRLVETIKFFIEPTLKSKQNAVEAGLKNTFDVDKLITKTELINEVMVLQQQLSAKGNTDPVKIQQLLNEYMQKIMKPSLLMPVDDSDAPLFSKHDSVNK